MQLALPNAEGTLKGAIRLPPVVPPFNTRAHRLFSVIWIAAFLLAFAGPLAGFYFRYTSPENNSQLLLGSRAGFAVSPRDATTVRFTHSGLWDEESVRSHEGGWGRILDNLGQMLEEA